MGGIVKKENAELVAAGGTTDHVHLLIKIEPIHVLATLVRKIKSNSSKFINNEIMQNFAWQEGYGIFSVSSSKVATIKNYIARQELHHKKMSFQEELVLFLEKHKIVYPKDFLFD